MIASADSLEMRAAQGILISQPLDAREPHFLFLQGAHDKGTLFLFLTTRYEPSVENCPLLEAVADGGVGVIFGRVESCKGECCALVEVSIDGP